MQELTRNIDAGADLRPGRRPRPGGRCPDRYQRRNGDAGAVVNHLR
ncbi:hypothetical protein [Nocardiopsis kunsanensis]|nr:hypothetical protein [Nocardiopsis kunsanensis]